MAAGRCVSLVLCDGNGDVLGALPSFTVDDPWWPEVGPVVSAARGRFAADVIVLRMLHVASDADNGGDVTYLAELVGEVPPHLLLGPAPAIDDGEEPLRAAWARPGGVANTIAWADDALGGMGRPRVGPVEQIKTWNLSSVLRFPTTAGDVWCKSVPPFLTHEGAIIELVGTDEPTLVPPLLASDPAMRTMLLDSVPGEDDWDAPAERLLLMVDHLVRLQARWSDRLDELLGAGLPDWRTRPLDGLVEALVSRAEVRAQLTDGELRGLDALVGSLPMRLETLDACGIPETLVHGDFHPGNWRSDGHSLVLLDWGDAGVGHPMLDMSSFDQYVPDDIRPRIREAWIESWRDVLPGSDPPRAETVIAPIAALRRAVIYQGFLDRIEPSERRYHEADVRDWLRAALERAADGEDGDQQPLQ
jgi:Phosphotransferase enzyme family